MSVNSGTHTRSIVTDHKRSRLSHEALTCLSIAPAVYGEENRV